MALKVAECFVVICDVATPLRQKETLKVCIFLKLEKGKREN